MSTQEIFDIKAEAAWILEAVVILLPHCIRHSPALRLFLSVAVLPLTCLTCHTHAHQGKGDTTAQARSYRHMIVMLRVHL